MTIGQNSPYLDWNAVETMQFDWGYIKWITAGDEHAPGIPAAGMVVMLPGQGHERHNHPESHELLYVIAGEGEQMVEDEHGSPVTRLVRAGDMIRIARGVYHSTLNTGWEPMRVLAIYAPAGAENALTVGLFEGRIRANLEETGLGFDREVDMIRIAREMDLFTSPYAFTPQEAKDLASVGADLVVAHVGTSSSGLIGAESVMPMGEALQRIAEIEAAAHTASSQVMVLCHGGPVVGAEEAEHVISQIPGVVGFYGASSMERIPVDRAIIDNLETFKKISLSAQRNQ